MMARWSGLPSYRLMLAGLMGRFLLVAPTVFGF
jgi:hypothetical protein